MLSGFDKPFPHTLQFDAFAIVRDLMRWCGICQAHKIAVMPFLSRQPEEGEIRGSLGVH